MLGLIMIYEVNNTVDITKNDYVTGSQLDTTGR